MGRVMARLPRLCPVLAAVACLVGTSASAQTLAPERPVPVQQIAAGATQGDLRGTILAAALNVRLAYLEGGEVGPALGAAKLAMMAVTGASAAQACTRPPVSHAIEPDPALTERLVPRLSRFRAAYAALKSL